MTSNRPTNENRIALARNEATYASNVPELQTEQSDTAAVEKPALSNNSENLMERIVAQANMAAAWKNVWANHGAPGPDGITLTEFLAAFRHQWPEIRRQLLERTYQPGPARRKSIPKPDGSQRHLGHSQCPGQTDPASHLASPDADLRSRLLGVEFRLPTEAIRSRSSPAGAGPYPDRLPSLRGHGSGQIL
jgi:RNA-directed DNA polymerase